VRIIIISDCHVGHRAAPWPAEFEVPETGHKLCASPEQLLLLEYIDDFFGQPEAQDAEMVINLAESIEGASPKDQGRDLMTPELDYQIDAWIDVFGSRIGNRKYYAVHGSGYHDSENLYTEDIIARRMGGEFCGQIANLKVKGKILNIAHDPGNAMIYKTTMLDRQSLFADAIEGPFPHDKLPFHVDAILRAHVHQYYMIDNESRCACTFPTWTFWHPIRKYGAKNYFKTQPSIGGVVIEVGSRVWIKPFLYPIQPIYDRLIET
jgi:hypothetical protein